MTVDRESYYAVVKNLRGLVWIPAMMLAERREVNSPGVAYPLSQSIDIKTTFVNIFRVKNPANEEG